MAAGPGRDSLQGPEVLEHGALPLGRGSEDGQRVVAGLLVRGRSGVLRGGQHADASAPVALVGQHRHPQTRPTGTGPVAHGASPRSGRGSSRAPPGPCTPGTPRESITTVAAEHLPQDLSTTDDGPLRGCAEPPGRCGSGSRPGSRLAPRTGAVAEGPREVPGPGRRSPPKHRSGYL